jgi:hypothetical protein
MNDISGAETSTCLLNLKKNVLMAFLRTVSRLHGKTEVKAVLQLDVHVQW